MRRTSEDFGGLFGEQAERVIRQNFYVDDCLRSDEAEDEAIEVAGDLRSLSRLGGFNLTEFASTSRRLLKSLLPQEREKDVKSLDLIAAKVSSRFFVCRLARFAAPIGSRAIGWRCLAPRLPHQVASGELTCMPLAC